MQCRHCSSPLEHALVDLGSAPLSNAYLSNADLSQPEKWYPLRVMVCEHCWLVQTEDVTQPKEMFNAHYAYFSGISSTWLAHCECFVDQMVKRLALTANCHVVEVAANDGHLLQYFTARGVPCMGVEPTASTAAAARAKGIPIVEKFFGVELAKVLVREGKHADLIVANNVLAHVPDINDFVEGFTVLLKRDGVASFEFPHLLRLIVESQFDTIYHEHFSYLSLTAVNHVFSANGLMLVDVEEHPTHGGSLRVFAQRNDAGRHIRSPHVDEVLRRESDEGMLTKDYYTGFQAKINKIKDDFLAFLIDAKRQCKTVVAYGAAAKGNTLLNYAGIRPDLIAFVADRSPAKQGQYLPGSRIPILHERHITESRPDYVIILPWNLQKEVITQLDYIRTWNGKFVTAIPQLQVV